MNSIKHPQAVDLEWHYISHPLPTEDNLPGTGDTVIKQAVPPGGDSALHLAVLKPAISQTGRLGCIIFGRGGLRSRIPRTPNHKNETW